MTLASHHTLQYIVIVAQWLRFHMLMLLQLWKISRCVCSHIEEFVHFQALPVQYVMAKYLLELCLVDYDMCHYAPSLISAAAIYLALW